MRVEPTWLTPDQLVVISDKLGPNCKLRDRTLLENAVAAPQNAFHYDGQDDLLRLAVRLLESVVRAHAFRDGNKRVAFHAAALFLESNGLVFAAPDIEEVGRLITDLVERKIAAEDLHRAFAPFVIKAVQPPSQP